MAAGVIAQPGSAIGPCTNLLCGHIDCDKTRTMAGSECPYCHEEIGYGRRFYQLDGEILVHASCYEAAIEKERRKDEPTTSKGS